MDLLNMIRADQIDFEQAVYDAFGQVKDFTIAMRIARYFYELGLNARKVENIRKNS